MAKSKQRTKKKESFDRDIYVYIFALCLITLTIIASRELGVVGRFLTVITKYMFGTYYGVVYGILIAFGIYLLFFKKKPAWGTKGFFACCILFMALILWSAIPTDDSIVGLNAITDYVSKSSEIIKGTIPAQGGILGAFLYSISSMLFARAGTIYVLFALLLLSLILVLDFKKIKKWISSFMNSVTVEVEEDEEKPSKKTAKIKPITIDIDQFEEEVKKEKKKSVFIDGFKEQKDANKEKVKSTEVAKTSSAATVVSDGSYQLPKLSLLDEVTVKNKSNLNTSAANIKGQKLIEILNQFGINASLIATHIGPSVTKFEVKPDSNVKISKIAAIQDNIKMELAARDIRIEAPIPGRNAVGIEIPNVETTPVRLLELLKNIPSEKQNKKLLFTLGKDLMGKTVLCELDRMPHLLIAGATGSGKSVCVNSIITTLLLRTTPEEVKLLLIDPKKVEFMNYMNVPHLIGPVISDAVEASRALKVIVMMMENRYDVFSKVGVRNIQSYNELLEKGKDTTLKTMPWIVVIIDELADLMSVAGKEVEQSIQRITQLARAAGIHLIVATQRPSTDVITGIIKANIPSRIAFAVSSGIDSRTILDTIGAERLLGYGDMLYIPIGEPSTIRLQGVYVTDEEISRITEFVSSQAKPHYDDAFIRLEALDNGEEATGIVAVSDDPLYEEVKKYIIETKKASTSSIQRRFGLGYNRAARLIDVLEEKGIIGPAQGSKPRDVYVKNNEEEQEDE